MKKSESQKIEIPNEFLANPQEVLASAAETLPPQLYHDLKFEKNGTQKAVLSCRWGNTKRALKVNMLSEGTEKNLHKFGKGYGAKHELEILQQLPEAREHQIDAPFEAYIDNKRGAMFAVHEFIEGTSLEDRVKEKPLSVTEAKQFLTDSLDALTYTRANHVLHRDLNAANFILSSGRTKLTDFGVACTDDKVDSNFAYSLGGRALDPRLFDGTPSDEVSEIHGLAESLAYGLIGQHAIAINPTKRKATALDTGESLVGSDDKLDEKKLQDTYDRYLAKLPEKSRKFKKLLSKAFRREYGSLEEFASDAEKSMRPSLIKRVSEYWKPIVLSTLALATVATGSCALTQRAARNQPVVQQRYPVAVAFNGVGPEIDNSVIELGEPNVYIVSGSKKPGDTYPENKFLKLKQGQELCVSIRANEKPWPRKDTSSQPTYPGRVYFEGYSGADFSITPISFNRAFTTYENSWNYGSTGVYNFKVPTNMPPGIRNLVVELYSPGENKIQSDIDARKEMALPEAGKVINRKLIPMQIGEVSSQASISEVKLEGYQNSLSVTQPGASQIEGRIPRDLTYVVEVPEENFREEFKGRYPAANMDNPGFNLPSGTNLEQRTLIMKVMDGTNLVQQTYLPISRKKIIEKTFWWGFSVPDKGFYETIQKYEKTN